MGARNGLSSASSAKTCYRELHLLQVGQEKTFPRDQEGIAQGTEQGNTLFSSELPSTEIDLAAQPWPGAELLSGRMVRQFAC